ncbi:hypothetical protein FSP39_024722 [Pinctada imbricata]|uniref:C-type lectin domain-containing protein n=1 Tax=Pinctada imbricata TaxID=66713 RepID=A0AA88YL22_PINIB|nr:hypothetical protein FSP39_024722 [Pinctada imbricata]
MDQTCMQIFSDFHETTFWLGSSDFAIEGSWRWVETGTGFTGYTNWATGFPDGNRTHNCLLMKYIGNTPQWVDYNCNSKSYYICETPYVSQ